MAQALTLEEKKEKALAKKEARKERPSFTGTKQKLTATPIEGKHLHWFNEYAGRISEALSVGYEFVESSETELNDFVTPGNSDLGTRVKRLVGKDDNGGPLYAYLMKIDESLWQEDQAKLQEKNDRVDLAIRRGEMGDVGNRYGSVKID